MFILLVNVGMRFSEYVLNLFGETESVLVFDLGVTVGRCFLNRPRVRGFQLTTP